MKPIILYILLVTGLFFRGTPCGSQELVFHNLNMLQGLANNNTNSVCFDKNGFAWVTSLNGLNLFDGKNVFHFNKQSHPELPINQLGFVYCDSRNRIWVCSNSGLAMLDENRKVHRLTIVDSLPELDVDYCFEVMGKGMVAIAGNKAFFIDHEESTISSMPWLNKILHAKNIHHLQQLNDDRYLVQMKNELWLINFREQKALLKIGLPKLETACLLNDNEILAVTEDFNLHRIDIARQAITATWNNLKDQQGSYFKAPIRAAITATNGHVYMTSKGNGLISFDPGTASIYTYTADVRRPNAIKTNTLYNPQVNENGYLVITSDLGIQFTNINNYSFQHHQYANAGGHDIFFQTVKSIVQDSKKQLWISMDHYLLRTDADGNNPKIISGSLDNGQLKYSTLQMDLDAQDRAWVPYRSKGIMVYDNDGNLFNSITGTSLPIEASSLRLVKKLNQSLMLAGTDNGIMIFNTLDFSINNDHRLFVEKLEKERIVDVLAKHNDVWIATSPNGSIWHYNLATKRITNLTKKQKIPSNRFYCLALAPGGQLLVGTYSGLIVFENNKITHVLTEKNGLLNPRVDNIQFDRNGMAWISNHNALLKYDMQKKSFDLFDERNGLMNFSFTIASGMQTQSGELMFGTTKGYLKFDPSKVNNQSAAPNVIVKRLLDGNLMQVLNKDNRIEIPHNDAKLNFYFTTSDLIAGSRMVYRYKLDGVDESWSQPTKNNFITYKLSPGRYTFHLQASYNSSNWFDDGTDIFIVVKPPFWQTTWFLLLSFAGLAFIALAGYAFFRERKLQTEGLKLINYFTSANYPYRSKDELLWDMARNCSSRLGLEDCVIYEYLPDKKVLVQKAASGPKSPADKVLINYLEIPLGQGIVGSVAEKRKGEIISNTAKDPRYITDDATRLSEVAVPILHDGVLLGVIDSESSKKNYYTSTHLHILNMLAAVCAEKLAGLQARHALEKQEKEVADLNRQMNETRLSAIRAQMNPHFLFNSLNAIQECILSEKYDSAYEYLSRFSRLLRLVLNHSEKNFISLNDELETIKLYLSLEELRFRQGFSYKLEIDEEIDTEEVMVPSLLLQPFVENAIWHGLVNKEGQKNLNLQFYEEGNMLRCIIQDNGIGRERSAWIKKQKMGADRFTSKGTMLSEKRINILNQQFSNMAQIETIDHFNQANESLGTSVIITLPMTFTEPINHSL